MKKGFTLVEFTITLTIIAILMMVILPGILNQIEANEKKQFINNSRMLYNKALEDYQKNKMNGNNTARTYTEDSGIIKLGDSFKYKVVVERDKAKYFAISNTNYIYVSCKELLASSDIDVSKLEKYNESKYIKDFDNLVELCAK